MSVINFNEKREYKLPRYINFDFQNRIYTSD